ncbi:inositol monophosphatase [Marinicauda algicola]|uniref:Inositol-1-monophosphatase n=2 Tax=Marinicauda algicola TaxID=2029849 RepID=A0A4V3RY80_9PROT|nr:inositol monophosphatase [Marinicauda algicola]
MIGAARKAGRKLSRDFGELENLQVSRKGPADFVSKADHASEEIIFEELSRARPGYGFLMEERGRVEGSDRTHTWIVDPLDGTLNFLHAQPHFAISIALEREGELVAGVIYNPASDDLFHAEKGRGAFMSDRRIRVSARRHLEECVIATGTPFFGKKGHAQFLKELHKIMPHAAGIRRYGAASLDLAWTAAGRFDGFWERSLAPWDIAAGIVLVREAGGFAGAIEDTGDVMDTGDIVAGNEHTIAELRRRLAEAG